MTIHLLSTFFHVDALTGVMMTLVSFIGLTVGLFATRYLAGDSEYYLFFARLGCLILSLAFLVAADHLLFFLLAWGISNVLLIQLMVHKPVWQAAVNAGKLASKSFMIGFICLACAFALLYTCTKQTSIQMIVRSSGETCLLSTIALILMTICAMSQSAIWPLHRWLISSLNSPTPVSAIMHAGLVNGGGFLLLRFAPLYLAQPKMLTVIFILGLGTAVVGTLWKLMQHDIKKMLACSTMGQMGFMFVQCGLGLFPAALAHLCWHGLFKANLFLSANSVVQEKRLTTLYPATTTTFILACLSGFFGSTMFAWVSGKSWLTPNTNFILLSVVLIAAAQFALNLLQNTPWKKLPLAILLTGLMCILYGYTVYQIEYILSPLHFMHAQVLNIFHYIGAILLFGLWTIMVFKDHLIKHSYKFKIIPAWYVKTLNASQPDPTTITAHRQQYQYKRG